MDIKNYTPEDKDACIAVFNSNTGKYFTDSEREEYIHFLDNQALEGAYFTLAKDGDIVACGGFAPKKDYIVLTWGMVRREMHGTGIGAELVKYRLNRVFQADKNCTVKTDTSQHTEGFYRKYGFKTCQIIKNGFGEGIDQVCMEYTNPF